MSDDHTEAGWRQQVARDRAHVVALLAVSVPVALLVPWLFVRLFAAASAACGDLGAGTGYLLMLVWFGLALLSGASFWVGALVAGRMNLAIRAGSGLLVVLVLCVAAAWPMVPLGAPSDFGMTASGECGPGGVPTWWPAILPHH